MPSRTFLANSRPISVRGRTSIVRIIPEIYDSKSRNPSNLKYSGCVSNRIFKDSVRIYSAEIRNSTHTSLMGRKQMTDLEKGQILGMARSHSPREIAKAIGRDYRTIHRLLKKFQTTGSTDRVQGSGRKRKTSPRKDRLIKRIALSDRRLSSSEIRKKLDLDVSTKTIRNRLHEFGIKSYWSIKKPFISETNRTKRLAWAKEHLNWSADRWASVLWSDESPFLLRYKGRQRVWRSHNERYVPQTTTATVKHDQKINVWGCFSLAGVGDLHLIHGNMDQHQYHSILVHHMMPSAKKLFPNGKWTFQQDNDPKHTAKKVQDYLASKGVDVMKWPAQSPDLNPIENLWSYFDSKMKDRSPSNEEELFQLLRDEWKKIPAEYLASLIESMPRRCQAVIDNDGFVTKY